MPRTAVYRLLRTGQVRQAKMADLLTKVEKKEPVGLIRLGWVMDYPVAENYLGPLFSTSAHPPAGHTSEIIGTATASTTPTTTNMSTRPTRRPRSIAYRLAIHQIGTVSSAHSAYST